MKNSEACRSLIESIKNEGKEEGIRIGIKEEINKGKAKRVEEKIRIGKLNILNALANDPNSNYTAEELAEKFGFTVEEILNGT